MKTYRIVFMARRLGALGIRSQYTRLVTAENAEKATLALYVDFDHITVLELREVANGKE